MQRRAAPQRGGGRRGGVRRGRSWLGLARREPVAVLLTLGLLATAVVAFALGLDGVGGALIAGLVGLGVGVALRTQHLQRAEVRGLRATVTDGTRRIEQVERGQQRILRLLEDDLAARRTREGEQVTRVAGLLDEQTREFEALLQLPGQTSRRAPMPPSMGWSMSPTNLLGLLHLVERRQPKVVCALGSGAWTVWLAYAVESFGGRLVCADHRRQYAEQAAAWVSAHGLDTTAVVRTAPLRSVTVDGETFRWYDQQAFADLDGIDLLVVGGPPATVGRHARQPAVPLLVGRLSPTATVVLDDADEPDEVETLRRWTRSVDGLVREDGVVGSHAVLSYTRPLD